MSVPVWVDPVEVHGPYFADEVELIRGAVAARLREVPGVVVVETAAWEALATQGKTAPDGPVCAAPPRVDDLVARHLAARPVHPVLDGRVLTFVVGETEFETQLPWWDVGAWPGAVAATQGRPRLRGGGLRGTGHSGGPMGIGVDQWGWSGPVGAATLRSLGESLEPCRDLDPSRSRHLDVEHGFVVAYGADGLPLRVEETEGHGSAASRACIAERLMAWSQSPAPTPGRWVVWVVDRAPEPVTRLEGLLNFRIEASLPWLSVRGLYDEPRFRRCPIPMGETSFTLNLDPAGRVTDAQVGSQDPGLKACLEEVLRAVPFACPGPAGEGVTGQLERR